MDLIEEYKKEICTNCKNKNCTKNIKKLRHQEVFENKINTTIVVKCEDFICKVKMKKRAAKS